MKPKKNTPKPLIILVYVMIIGIALVYKNTNPEVTPTNDIASIFMVAGILLVSALVKYWEKRKNK